MPYNYNIFSEVWEEAKELLMIKVHDHLIVLEVQDEITMKELEVAAELEAYVAKRLGPTAAVLAPERAGLLVTRLRKQGYTPKVSGGEA